MISCEMTHLPRRAPHRQPRGKAVIGDNFRRDVKTWIIITSYSGEIHSLLGVLGHRPFSLSTGQTIPVLVKTSNNRKTENRTAANGFWTFEPTCMSPPVTSGTVGSVLCNGFVECGSGLLPDYQHLLDMRL